MSFPGAVEPARQEWFIAETQPTGTPTNLDDSNPQILSPAADTIIALDPDIPAAAQRVVFEASRGARDSHWMLDGRALAPVRGELLWTPSPGAHTLSIVRDSGRRVRRQFNLWSAARMFHSQTMTGGSINSYNDARIARP